MRFASLVVALGVAVVLLVWLASWYGPRVAAAGVALLGLGWLLHDDSGTVQHPRRDSSP